jgi:transposase
MNQTTRNEDSTETSMLYMAMELSKRTWKLGFGVGNRKCRKINVAAGNVAELCEAIRITIAKLKLPHDTKVRSCYEAGRDGFWIHHMLLKMGVDNIIVDPASIEVNRRRRRAKTDRLDVERMLKGLVTYHEHDPDTWSVVRVPSVQDEDDRRTHRERGRLIKERTAHRTRIQALLATMGIERKPTKDFATWLDTAQLYNGSSLPMHLKDELKREYRRLELVEEQLKKLKKLIEDRIKVPQTKSDEKAALLASLVAVGPLGAWIVVKELFAWRAFRNRRQVGSIVGLTPTPYDSGDSDREQGISKAGNARVRTLMTQLAWIWLRYQPDSQLSKWFQHKFGSGASRSRRVGIIALARKLLIAFWRWVDQGVLPEGAQIRALPSPK